ASSAIAAVQKKVRTENTAENRAITRYRMVTAPDGKAGSPAVGWPPPGGTQRRYGMGVVFFRPRAGINTLPRHFFGAMSQARTARPVRLACPSANPPRLPAAPRAL